MNRVKRIFGDRCLARLTSIAAESHMNTISISKEFIKKTYY